MIVSSSPIARRSIRSTVVALCVLAGVLVVGSASALAAAPALVGSFGSFEHPTGVAVDEANGNVFVANGGGPEEVAVFSESGGATPVGGYPASLNPGTFGFGGEPVGVAIDNSASTPRGAIYVTNAAGTPEALDKFTLGGSSQYEAAGSPFPLAATAEPIGAAVDAEGNVYMADYGGEVVREYSPAGAEIAALSIAGIERPQGVAVDSKGDLFVTRYSSGILVEAERSSPTATTIESTSELLPGGVSAVAIDRSTNMLFVDLGTKVTEYSLASGTPVEGESFGEGTLGKSLGLAVNESTGTIYVSDATSKNVDIYQAGSSGPTLTIVKSGTGSGTVECKAGAASFEACASSYAEGEEITIKGAEGAGSKFEGWQNGAGSAENCAGTSECTFTLEEDSSVEAEFKKEPLPTHLLEVEVTGEGEVTGGEIACGTGDSGTCSEAVEETSQVKLTEESKTGWRFVKWSVAGAACEGGDTAETCEFAMPGAPVTVEAEFVETRAFALTVFVTGEGQVTTGTQGMNPFINCGPMAGLECTGEFEGAVTLKGNSGTGYVLAGWLGCKKTGTETCEVDVTEAREVTAVFLKEGEKGDTGSQGNPGTDGTDGSEGPKGTPGTNGANGANGSNGENGAPGANGEKGANGANGAAGSPGPAGPGGPAGAAGKEGPTGKVTCKVKQQKKGKKVKVTCTVKVAKASAALADLRSVHWSLSRHGHTVAHGAAASGRDVRLSASGLSAGRYTLTLVGGSGRHQRIHRESFTLR